MKKYKIHIDKLKIDADTIENKKNFREIIVRVKIAKTPIYRRRWFKINSIILPIAALLVFLAEVEDPVTSDVQADRVKSPSKSVASRFIDDIPFDTYIIDAEKKNTIFHGKGTRITIPALALIDSNGNNVYGDIELHVREFSSPDEFFVADIPMNYDSVGMSYTFESAGMIELKAMQNNNPVFVSDNKLITVDLVSDNDDTDFNVYKFDSEAKKWVYKGKDKVMKDKKKTTKPKEIITVQDPQVFLSKKDDVEDEIKQIKKQEPLKPVKAKADKHHFSIEVSKDEFPEIAVYENTTFEVDESFNAYNPDNANIVWHDVKLTETDVRFTYIVTFTYFDKIAEYKVTPVFYGDDLKKAEKVYAGKLEEYKNKLNAKNDEIKRLEKMRDSLEKVQEQRQVLLNLQQKQSLERQKGIVSTYKKDNMIYRSFTIDGFGIWNCDKVLQNTSSVLVNIILDLPDSVDIFTSFNIVNDKRNALYNYWTSSGSKVMNVRFERKSKNVAWFVLSDKSIGIITPEMFDAFKKRNNMVVPQIVKGVKTPEDFKKVYKEALFGKTESNGVENNL